MYIIDLGLKFQKYLNLFCFILGEVRTNCCDKCLEVIHRGMVFTKTYFPQHQLVRPHVLHVPESDIQLCKDKFSFVLHVFKKYTDVQCIINGKCVYFSLSWPDADVSYLSFSIYVWCMEVCFLFVLGFFLFFFSNLCELT